MWVEPFILYKYGFFRKLSEYFNLYAMYTMSFLICAGITYYITFSIKGNVEMLIIKAIVCTIIYNLMITLIFWRTNEMKTLIRIIADLFSMKLEMQHHH